MPEMARSEKMTPVRLPKINFRLPILSTNSSPMRVKMKLPKLGTHVSHIDAVSLNPASLMMLPL